MSDRAGLASVFAAVVSVFVAVVVVVAAGTAGAVQPPSQVDIDADSVTLRADVQADGDAAWTVTYRLRLEDDNATEAFDELQADIESDPAPYLDPFTERMERTAAGAENATGREMAIRNVTIETRRESQPQVEFGVVTYRLEWDNFAAVEGETIRAGDAIDQLFLDSRTSLRVTAPEGYAVESATPEPTRSGTAEVTWQGQRDFDPGEPRIVLVPDGGTPPGTPGESDGGDGSGTSDASDDGGAQGTPADGETPAGGSEFPFGPVLAVVALVLLGGAWLVVRRGEVVLPSFGDSDDSDDSAGVTATAADDGPPPELLSNEERILQLLAENGGRMKQKAVAEQLDWTAAKTSQVVGDLRDDGEVESFRLGRENVLTLPDVDIDGAGGSESGDPDGDGSGGDPDSDGSGSGSRER